MLNSGLAILFLFICIFHMVEGNALISDCIPANILKDHSCYCLGYHMQCWKSNPGWSYASPLFFGIIISLVHVLTIYCLVKLIIFTCFWVTPQGTQGLLLALYLRITPDMAQRNIWGYREPTQIVCMQWKHPTHCTPLQL